MRIARDFGTVSELLPEGVADVRDMPHTLFDNVRLALHFLSWEELPPEDQPPRRIWLDDELLTAWFEEVKRRREDERKGESRDIDDPVQNEAAKGLLVG